MGAEVTSETGAARGRIRWLQRLAVAAAAGAVTLLLALIWELLPAPLDPNRVAPVAITTPPAAPPTTPRSTPEGDACARELIAEWTRLSPSQRRSDLHLQFLSTTAQRCSRTQPGLVATWLLRLDSGQAERHLHGVADERDNALAPDELARVRAELARGDLVERRTPSGAFIDRLWTLPDKPPTLALVQRYQVVSAVGTAVAAAEARRPDDAPGVVRQVQVLLSVLAVGLVGLVGISLRWLGRSQRDYQRTLREEITARQGAALALDSEIAFRKNIEESISVGLRVVGRDGRLTYVNRTFCTDSGWPIEALIGVAPPYPFWPEDHTDRLDEHLHVILAGEARPSGYRVPFVRPDGTRWTAQVSARALGSGEGWILASTDVSREMEDQRRIESMDAALGRQLSVHLLGEKSGELLHKISNHSSACLQALDGVKNQLKAGRHEHLAEGVRLAEQSAQDMSDTVQRFRPWLRGEPTIEPASLRETVADALAREGRYATAQNVVLHNGVSAGLAPVMTDRFALCEVISNLVRNAIWAMEDIPLTNRQLSVESYVDEDTQQVQIHVRDRGRGVPVALREKVFEHGYSTRHGGNGWGLHFCQHWVERLGGHMAVTDNLPRGADFVITLPLTPPTPEGSTDAPPRDHA